MIVHGTPRKSMFEEEKYNRELLNNEFDMDKIKRYLANRYFNSLRDSIVAWEQRNFPNTPAYRNLLGVGEELGELYHAHLKGEQGIRQSAVDTKIKKMDAIGDMLVYLINYCNKEELCPLSCLEHAWAEVSKRDWVKYPKNGVSE